MKTKEKINFQLGVKIKRLTVRQKYEVLIKTEK